jgi:hypothetical protein
MVGLRRTASRCCERQRLVLLILLVLRSAGDLQEQV